MQMVNVVEGGERKRMSQAHGRLRHPRRADRRHRRRRDALLHAPAQPRHARSTSTSSSPARPRRRTPSTTSSTRTPGSRASCARPPTRGSRLRGRGRGRSPRGEAALGAGAEPPSGRWSGGCSSFPARSTRRPQRARRTGSAPTRWRPPPTSTPSIATAAWSAPTGAGAEAARLGALRGDQADDRDHPGAARGLRPGADVSVAPAGGRAAPPARDPDRASPSPRPARAPGPERGRRRARRLPRRVQPRAARGRATARGSTWSTAGGSSTARASRASGASTRAGDRPRPATPTWPPDEWPPSTPRPRPLRDPRRRRPRVPRRAPGRPPRLGLPRQLAPVRAHRSPSSSCSTPRSPPTAGSSATTGSRTPRATTTGRTWRSASSARVAAGGSRARDDFTQWELERVR